MLLITSEHRLSICSSSLRHLRGLCFLSSDVGDPSGRKELEMGKWEITLLNWDFER